MTPAVLRGTLLTGDSHRHVALAGSVVLAGAVLDASTTGLGVPFRVAPALPALLGVLFGPAGAAGVVVGWLAYALLGWTVSAVPLVPMAGGVAAALAGWSLRSSFRPEAGRRSRYASAVAVTWTSSLLGLAVAAWTGVVLGVQPFVTAASVDLPTLIAVLALGPLALVAIGRVAPRESDAGVTRRLVALAALAGLWVSAGAAFSLLRLWAVTIPDPVIGGYLPTELTDLFVFLVQDHPLGVQRVGGLVCATLAAWLGQRSA